MPVTDTSKKVRNVIKRRQLDGQWICAAPYGYIVNKKKEFEIVPTEADIIRRIFSFYNNDGWGYKKIANYLTAQGIPTPRMSEQLRKEAEGAEYKREVKNAWSIITVQGILDNDFYIGTLRQGKTTRAKINGKDVKRDDGEQVVIENHHQPIIDYRTFATTRALREKRSRSNYRGVKKYDNVYSGYLECGDCGSPMFSMSRGDLPAAYTCGSYHRRGLAGCTSHHIRVDKLDELLKIYVKRLMDHSTEMLDELNADLTRENDQVAETEQSADHLDEVLQDLREELKATKRQRIRDILKHPDQEDLLAETYDEMESDLQKKIEGLIHQIELLADKRNTIIRVNRAAKTALDVFSDILRKEKLDRGDLDLLIEKIKVFEDHLEIRLKPDIDTIIRADQLENTVNFNGDMHYTYIYCLVQRSAKGKNKVLHVHVICDGDPLEIYTSGDGEVVFRKYSPIGELSGYAGRYADVLYRMAGLPVVVCDRDQVVAAAGVPKKDYLSRRITPQLEQLELSRRSYLRGQPHLAPLCPRRRGRAGGLRGHPGHRRRRRHRQCPAFRGRTGHRGAGQAGPGSRLLPRQTDGNLTQSPRWVQHPGGGLICARRKSLKFL